MRALALTLLVASQGCDGAAGSLDAGVINPNRDADGGTTEAAWTSLRPLPAPRQETAVVELGGAIYVIGGFDRSQVIVSTVERYDPATDTWTAVQPLPRPLHHVNAAVLDGKIFVVGALTVGFAAVGDLYEYDPKTNVWTPRGQMPSGSERGASLVAALNGEIFIGGGLRGGVAVADFSSWTPSTGQFTERAPLPTARDHGAGAAADGRFFAIGGRGAGIGAHTARVDAYDPQTDTWSGRTPMPTSRGGMAAAVVSGRIVVAGGEGNASAASGVFDQVERFDPSQNLWTTLPPMKTPRHGTGAAAVGDVFYVPGGATVQAFGAVATLEALVIP